MSDKTSDNIVPEERPARGGREPITAQTNWNNALEEPLSGELQTETKMEQMMQRMMQRIMQQMMQEYPKDTAQVAQTNLKAVTPAPQQTDASVLEKTQKENGNEAAKTVLDQPREETWKYELARAEEKMTNELYAAIPKLKEISHEATRMIAIEDWIEQMAEFLEQTQDSESFKKRRVLNKLCGPYRKLFKDMEETYTWEKFVEALRNQNQGPEQLGRILYEELSDNIDPDVRYERFLAVLQTLTPAQLRKGWAMHFSNDDPDVIEAWSRRGLDDAFEEWMRLKRIQWQNNSTLNRRSGRPFKRQKTQTPSSASGQKTRTPNVCYQFRKYGECFRGDNCRYEHPKEFSKNQRDLKGMSQRTA